MKHPRTHWLRPFLLAGAILVAACGGENLTPPGIPSPADAWTCFPNLDGRIDAEEMTPQLGTAVSYDLRREVPIDLSGRDEDGVRIWDWSSPLPAENDPRTSLAATALRGRWYESEFPGGEFVLPLELPSEGETPTVLDAVYRFDDEALWLLGLASSEERPKTLLRYSQPVALYRYPIQPGAEWHGVGEVTGGYVSGLPYHGRDTYAVRVTEAGHLRLPEVTFTQAMAVHTTVTVDPDLAGPVTQQQVSFLFECFGEVARATGRSGDDNPDFDTAAELRRLILEAP